MNNRVPINFEIPTIYWPRPGDKHYIPPRTSDERVAAARRLLPPGTLKLAQQLHGVRIASLMLGLVTTEKDKVFTSQLVSAAAFGSAGYTYGIESDRMRRNVTLPVQIHPITGERKTDFDRELESREALVGAFIASNVAVREKVVTSKLRAGTSMIAGRAAANAALNVSLLPYRGIAETGSRAQVQRNVLDACMESLVAAKELAADTGTFPTFAQLPDPYSDTVVYLHQKGSPDVATAWEEATNRANALAAVA